MGKIRIDLDGSFTANKNYYVLADEGFAVDANTGEPSPAITDKNAVTFTAQPEFETIEYLPADNTVDFVGGLTSKSKRIDITFEQDVFKGDSGTINLFSDSTLIESFDILTDVYFRFSPPGSENTTGKTITIYASDWFENTSPTHVIISDGALRDAQCMTNREMDSRTNPNLSVTFNMQSAQPIPTMGDSRITLRYCEDIVKLSGNAYLYDSNDTLIETMDVATQGGVSGDTLTLTPKYQLEETKEYYVTTDRGVIGDDHGFSFGPLVKGDTNVVQTFFRPYATFNIVLQFNRDVKSSADYPAEGKVYLKRQSDDETVKTWDVKWNSDWIGSENPYYPNNYEPTGINISSEDIITYNDNRATLKAKMAQGGAYYLLIDSGAFKDLDRIPLDEIALASAWDFEVYDGPTVSSATFNAGGTATMTFNDTINIGNSDQIFLYRDSDDALIDTIQSPSQVTLLNNQVTFNTSVFDSVSKDYYILSDKEILTDDENYQFRGITDKTVATLSSLNSLVSSVPSDDQTEFKTPVSTGFSMTFDRDIQAGTGNISLYRTSDDALIEAFDVTSDVTFAGDTASWNSSAALDPLTQYYILVDASAIDSTDGDSFEGISSKTAFNFETFSFALSTTSPGDNAVGVDFLSSVGFNLSFNDPIEAGTGNISLYRTSDDALIEAFDVTSDVSIVNDTVTCVVTEPVDEQTDYYVLVDGTAINSVGGLNYEGISSKTAFNFTIEAMTPTLSPLNGATVTGTEFTMTFAEDITELTGNISLYRTSDDALIETFDVANPSEVTVTSNEVFFERTSDLTTDTGYYILVDNDTFVSSNNIEYNGISNKATWSWTAQGPQYVSHEPEIYKSENLTITFDLDIDLHQPGDIRIRKDIDDSLIETINSSLFTVSNNILIVPLSVVLDSAVYYVEMDSGIVKSAAGGIAHLGFTKSDNINITMEIEVVSQTPEPNGTDVTESSYNLEFADIADTVGPGSFEIRRFVDDQLIHDIDIGSTTVTNTTELQINFDLQDAGLSSPTVGDEEFYVLASAGMVTRNGVSWPGYTQKSDWKFTVQSLTPLYNAVNTYPQNNNSYSGGHLKLEFDQDIFLRTGDIRVYQDGNLRGTRSFNLNCIASDNLLTITAPGLLVGGQPAYVNYDAGGVVNAYNQTIAELNNSNSWSFQVDPIADFTGVQYRVTGTDVGTLTLKTEASLIEALTGDIRIYDADTQTLAATLDVTTGAISGGNITFSGVSIPNAKDYYINLDESIIESDYITNQEISTSSELTFEAINGIVEFQTPDSPAEVPEIWVNGTAEIDWGNGVFYTYSAGFASRPVSLGTDPRTGTVKLQIADEVKFTSDSFTSINVTNSSGMTSFSGMIGTMSPRYLLSTFNAVDSSMIENMYQLFSGCKTNFTIQNLDTSNVTNMGKMFYECSELTSIPAMDTSNVTYMGEMFSRCTNLICLNTIDSTAATNTNSMFFECTSLTAPNASEQTLIENGYNYVNPNPCP